jgi:hypothetical protein
MAANTKATRKLRLKNTITEDTAAQKTNQSTRQYRIGFRRSETKPCMVSTQYIMRADSGRGSGAQRNSNTTKHILLFTL